MNLSNLNPRSRKIVSYLMLTLSAFIYTISIHCFIGAAKTLPSGLGAFAILPTFIWTNMGEYFSVFYIIFNIPLLVFFWKKNKPKFMIRTTWFIIVQALFGLIFLIPQVNEWSIYLTQGNNLPNDHGQLWRQDVWPILVLALVGSVIAGLAIVLAFMAGGSTGGSDIVVYFFSTKTRRDIGGIMFIISLTIVVISMGVSMGMRPDIRKYWLVTIVGTICYIMVSSGMISWLYPKYRLVKIDVVTTKCEAISKYLKETKFNHSWRIKTFESGYSGNDSTNITTIVFLLEKKEVIDKFKKIDPECWISIAPIREVHGSMSHKYFEIIN